MDPGFVMPAPAKHREPGVDLCAEAREVGLLHAFKRQSGMKVEWHIQFIKAGKQGVIVRMIEKA